MGSLSLTDGMRQPTPPMLAVLTKHRTLEGRNHGFDGAPSNMSQVTLQLSRADHADHADPTWNHQRLPSDPVLPTLPKIDISRQHGRVRGHSLVSLEVKNDFLLSNDMEDTVYPSMTDNSGKLQIAPIERISVDSPTNTLEPPFHTREKLQIAPIERMLVDSPTNPFEFPFHTRDDRQLSRRASASLPVLKSLASPSVPQQALLGSSNQEQVPFGKDWARVKKLRTDIWGLRSKMHELRREVKEKQQVRSVADNKYFQYMRLREVRMSRVHQDISEQKMKEELFQDCENARNECGPLEDDCTLLESHIGSLELELQRLEEKLYDRPFEILASQKEGLDSPQQSPTVSLYSGSEVSQDFHPLVANYLSRVGDAEILKERLDEHLEERYILEEEKALRRGLGHDLAEPAQKWLDNFSNTENLLMSQLEDAEQDVANMRQNCFQRGLVDAEGNPTDLESQERGYFANDVSTKNEKSEYVKYPLLIPRPGSRVQLKDPTPDSGESPDDSGNFVSEWLLQQLRSSPLDVNLLARISESLFGYLNREKWQSEVMKYWYKDSTKKEESQHPITSSLIMSSNHPTTGYASTLPSIKQENHEWGTSFQAMPLILGKFGGNEIATRDPFRLLRSSKYRKRATKSV